MKPILYTLTRIILWPLVTIFYKPKVVNKKYLKLKAPIILAGNHTSYVDNLIVGYTTSDDLYYVVKKELHKGLLKPIFVLFGTIPVDRKNHGNKDSKEKIINILKKNKKVVIFPEGTINKTEDIIMPFKYGAVSLAKKADAYIIPFAIKGKLKLFRRSVTITLDKPYKVKGNLTYENKKLEKKVIRLLKKGD